MEIFMEKNLFLFYILTEAKIWNVDIANPIYSPLLSGC